MLKDVVIVNECITYFHVMALVTQKFKPIVFIGVCEDGRTVYRNGRYKELFVAEFSDATKGILSATIQMYDHEMSPTIYLNIIKFKVSWPVFENKAFRFYGSQAQCGAQKFYDVVNMMFSINKFRHTTRPGRFIV